MTKLLVFAHTPPPVHGQSVMVATLLAGLQRSRGIELIHINPRLSRDLSDVGRWRAGKLLPLLRACLAAWWLRWRRGPAILYYVPAPGKRSALYRDLLVLALCRPFFPRLVLHWHAVGLGEWLEARSAAPERWLAHRLIGRADLALVLAPELAADAARFAPRRIAVIPNCVPDPGEPAPRPPRSDSRPLGVLFLGACSREKGLFDTLAAVSFAHTATPGGFSLVIAGAFPDLATEREFRLRSAELPAGVVRHVGFADETLKRSLFAAADVLCLPSAYSHEGQPLVVAEALAHDVAVIVTRWRALPSMLPAEQARVVDPGRPEQIAHHLQELRTHAPPRGVFRSHYLAHFTPARHLEAFETALQSITTDLGQR